MTLNSWLKNQTKLVWIQTKYNIPKNVISLRQASNPEEFSAFASNNNIWFIDVLSDGTAITYCTDE